MSLEDIRNERINKLKTLKEAGINPYPSESKRDASVAEFLADYDPSSNTAYWLSGRVMSLRTFGAIAFVDIYDGTETIQAFLKEEHIDSDHYHLFGEVIDVGDIIEVHGTAFTTERDERSILVDEWRILTKSLRPLPEKWHGLKDTETRLRRRYLDILFNEEVRELFQKKALFWQTVRTFLIDRGFLEVETPVLETTTGGADAEAFETHHNALDMDVYLRISAGELWQKELMVAGYPKVFEIGRIFRNEGMSSEHLQDYTQMEFYWAYADYRDGMELVIELYRTIGREVFGTTAFEMRGHSVDLAGEWERYDFVETIREMIDIDVMSASDSEIREKITELDIDYDQHGGNRARAVDALWKHCRKEISGPGFLVGVPTGLSPLAKRREDDPGRSERFQPIIAGSELGNGYSELNDPIDQANRFARQQAMREAGDTEAQMYNEEFIEALEYGMPPTCGFGMSERVFSFLAGVPIREAQIFPLMRPKKEND